METKPTAEVIDNSDLTAEEVARELAALMDSPSELKKLSLFIRVHVIRAKGSYEQLEQELIFEVVSRLLAGQRKWPRRLKSTTVIAEGARSVLYDMRNGKDALCYNNRKSPPANIEADDWIDSQTKEASREQLNRALDAKEGLQEVWKLFEDDGVAKELLIARDYLGYTPKEIQNLLNLSKTDYESKCAKIRRRLVKLAAH